jgi:hypothetical protein
MSGKPDEWVYKNTPKMNYEIAGEPYQASKGDYCSLNIATFTFGGRQNPILEGTPDGNMLNTFKKNNSFKKAKEIVATEEYGSNNSALTGVYRISQHNSFLSAVVHTLWHMKLFRNHILNELNINGTEKDSRNKLLLCLKGIFVKYTQGKMDISGLRNCLAENFSNRRKFLLEQPDDPVDCYYAFINLLHSHYIVRYLLILEISAL